MLTAELEVQFKGIPKLLQPIAGRRARITLREWMQALAGHVEAAYKSAPMSPEQSTTGRCVPEDKTWSKAKRGRTPPDVARRGVEPQSTDAGV